MLKLKLLLAAVATIFSSSAYAGWASSGGEVITDQNNAWFIQNTKTVRYCILIDEENFGQTKARSLELIQESIQYWKEQFAVANKMQPNLKVKTGMQEFVYVEDCNGANIDLRFQFGVLDSDDQRNYIKNLESLIAVAVRTEYDFRDLKAKGFIYIAASKGPLAIPVANRRESPWSDYNGMALRVVLTHELGHVFGIPHMDNRDLVGVMGQSLPYYMILNKLTPLPENQEVVLPKLFVDRSDKQFVSCTINSESDLLYKGAMELLLGIDKPYQCYGMKFSDNMASAAPLTVYGYEAKDSEPVVLMRDESLYSYASEIGTPIGSFYANKQSTLIPHDEHTMQLPSYYAHNFYWLKKYDFSLQVIRPGSVYGQLNLRFESGYLSARFAYSSLQTGEREREGWMFSCQIDHISEYDEKCGHQPKSLKTMFKY